MLDRVNDERDVNVLPQLTDVSRLVVIESAQDVGKQLEVAFSEM